MFFWHEILPSYVMWGNITIHFKDPYQTARIQWRKMSEGKKNKKKIHGHSEPKSQTGSFEVGDFSDHKGKTPSPPKANSFIARACFRPCFFSGEAAGVDGMALLREKLCDVPHESLVGRLGVG